MADKKLTRETVASMNEVRNAANEINNILKNFDVSNLSNDMQDIADKSKEMANSLSESQQYSTKNKNIAKEQAKSAQAGVKYATSTNIAAKLYRGVQIKLLAGQDKFTEGLKESVDVMGDMKSAASDIADNLSPIDASFEGMGATIGGALTNPITAAVGLLSIFEKHTRAIAAQFGAMGVTDFRKDLVAANRHMEGLGYSAEESQASVSQLANDFGMSIPEAAKLSNHVANTAKAAGLTLDEAGTLVGVFTETQGLTGQQAQDILLGTRQLAKANGVAPDKVLKDIAGNTELFARFSKDGGENILRAAVQARRLGINLDTVAKIADGLLNFQDSLNAEMEASVLLGRNLNLQKARELSLADDLENLQKEILNVVGSQAEFNKLNRVEKDALARAVNMEASELAKVIAKQNEQISLQGEINKKTAENEVPEDTLTATQKLMNYLNKIGTDLGESVGPGLSAAVESFMGMVKFIDKFIGLGNLAVGVMARLVAKSVGAAIANAALAYMKVTGKNPGPVGLALLAAAPVAIPALVGVIAAAVSGISNMASAKDGGITTQDGIMQVHKQEAIIPIDRLGGMIANAMKPIAEENRKLREQNENLINETRKIGVRTAEAIGAMG